jgi:hypothetical protein
MREAVGAGNHKTAAAMVKAVEALWDARGSHDHTVVVAHATATAMFFPANARLIFLTNKLTNDRYLVDTGATLSIVPCTASSSQSGPLFKGADGQPIPFWGFIKKTVQFQGKFFTSSFLQAYVAVPILGIDFLRKLKVTVAPEISQIHFACTTAEIAKADFKRLESAGIIRRSNLPWASSLHMVPKKMDHGGLVAIILT